MVVPPAGHIEMAVGMLKSTDATVIADQRKELEEAVGGRATEEFKAGYELGLATARVMIVLNMSVALAGLTADQIL